MSRQGVDEGRRVMMSVVGVAGALIGIVLVSSEVAHVCIWSLFGLFGH